MLIELVCGSEVDLRLDFNDRTTNWASLEIEGPPKKVVLLLVLFGKHNTLKGVPSRKDLPKSTGVSSIPKKQFLMIEYLVGIVLLIPGVTTAKWSMANLFIEQTLGGPIAIKWLAH